MYTMLTMLTAYIVIFMHYTVSPTMQVPHAIITSPTTLRQYCEAEPQLTETVCFMDANNGAGWDLLGSMVQGMPAAALLDHPFLLGEEQNSG